MLTYDIKITRVMDAVAAGTDDTNEGTVLDMSNCQGVVFVAAFGEITATSVTKIVAQQGDESDGSDMSDLEESAVSVTPATDNNKLVVLEIKKPAKRYVQCNVVRATANAVIDGMIAIQYGYSKLPVTQPDTVAHSEQHVSPDEGTA